MQMHSKSQRPTLNDFGAVFLKSTLPNVPYEWVNQVPNAVYQGRFDGNIESNALERLYSGRLATKKIPSYVGDNVEIALVTKIHPYLQRTFTEAMIQYFGKKSIISMVDFKEDYKNLGIEYMRFVQDVLRSMQMIGNDSSTRYVISMNFAPMARLAEHKKDVQSLAAIHTHVIGYSAEELANMEYVKEFSTPEEKRVFTGQFDTINSLYREIVYALLTNPSSRYAESINQADTLFYSQAKQSNKKTKLSMPYGFNFEIPSLDDISHEQFLAKIIAFEQSLASIYYDLADIFIENVESTYDITKKNEWLKLRPLDNQSEKLDNFLKRNSEALTPMTIDKLQESLLLSQALANKQHNLPSNLFLRGYAYSLVMYPKNWNKPNDEWVVSLPIWLYGGGGIEAFGINKVRPEEISSEGNEELLQVYLTDKENRDQYNRDLSIALNNLDPNITTLN